MKVCLVGSSGGHLAHLYMLKPFWQDKDRFWVTFDKEDARSLLEGEKMYPCYRSSARKFPSGSLCRRTKFRFFRPVNCVSTDELISVSLKLFPKKTRM